MRADGGGGAQPSYGGLAIGALVELVMATSPSAPTYNSAVSAEPLVDDVAFVDGDDYDIADAAEATLSGCLAALQVAYDTMQVNAAFGIGVMLEYGGPRCQARLLEALGVCVTESGRGAMC